MSWDLNQFREVVGIAATEFRYEIGGSSPSGLWEHAILNCPDEIDRVARDYVNASPDLIVAFTERLNRVTLGGMSDDHAIDVDAAVALNTTIITRIRTLAATAVRPPPVFAAIGPGESLWMLEEVGEAALLEAYMEQARGCIDAGADGFLCRSFSELEPMRIAVEAVRSLCDLPVIGSMTFDAGPDASDTASGVSIPEACRMLKEAGADMAGVDRSEFPDGTAAIVALLKQSGSLPVYAEVNAGRAEVVDAQVLYREASVTYGERFERLHEAGASIIGGGLGAGPDHVVQLIRQRDRRVRKGRRAKGEE